MRPLGHVAHRPAQPHAARAIQGGRGAALACALLVALTTGEALGQPGGLFREAAPAVARPLGRSDSITLRRRLVAIDFAQLTVPADTAAAVPGGARALPSSVLTLNLFDDASFTGLVQSVAPTFSGGYSLSGPLAGVEMGTMILVVNREVVAGTVQTPEATYRIRPAGAGLHAISQLDPSSLPPLGEPIPGRGWEEEERPPLGPDGGLPAPVEPGIVPPVPAAFGATEDAPSADAQGSIASDRAALEALYDATDGANWTDSTNWKTSVPLGEWFGVTTDTSGRVEALDLFRNHLTGPIPAEVGGLTNLRRLELRLNDLTGQVPAELGSLVNLYSLLLGGNTLTGQVPIWLGDLVDLWYLDLGGNALSGPIPEVLGDLTNLRWLLLGWNDLTGPIPDELGSLTSLTNLDLRLNNLTGPIPAELGSLVNLELLWLERNWGLSGPLPPGLRSAPLDWLNVFSTRACAPAAWWEWLKTISFSGRLCEAGPDVWIDVAVVYTPAARERSGGTAAIEAVIDLQIAETNWAYEASGVRHRVALTAREQVAYVETGNSAVDIDRLIDPADGHIDGVHALRDRVGADLVSLVVDHSDFGGKGQLPGVFSLVTREGGGRTFAHELGHNMGLSHDRWQVHHNEGGVQQHPAYGYVNQRAFEASAPESSRWITVMAYWNQCDDSDLFCQAPLRFSNPRQSYNGDPLGVPYTGNGESGVTGPADAAAVLNATGPAVALWRDRPAGSNRLPTAVGTLPDRELTLDGTLVVNVSQAFVDPDGDPLTFGASSSAPSVAAVAVAGSTVTVTPVGAGTVTIRVTATDPSGLSAAQLFTVTVTGSSNRPPEAVGVLAPLTIGLDEAAVAVDVSGAFRDPDGDALTYRATSSAPAVAAVTATGSAVTVTPVAEGTATVTVTATDVGGSNTAATQAFTVTVGGANRPPEAVGVLAPLTIGLDEAAVAVDVSGAFRDPDGDALTYRATSSAPAVAAVTATGSAVTVTPVAEGTATVTVTATDVGGSNTAATQAFTVTVGGANRPPEAVGVLAPLTIGLDEAAVAVDVSGAFRDPDGDALTYRATSSAPAVAAVSATGSAVTVTPVAEGTATVTVTATDVGGSNTAATQAFRVTVGGANRPPEAVGTLSPLTIGLDEAAVTVDVSGAFRDPDGDALTYGATSSAPAVAAVTATGSAVTVTPVTEGTATVTVAATDVGGSNTVATQAFTVTVSRSFTDPVITPGVTPVRAVHFTELRTRIDGVRASVGLGSYAWTDQVLTAGSTRVRLVHLLEMRWALAPVFAAKGRRPPFWTDAAPTAGSTSIRAAHLMELRAAVLALE